MMKLVFVENNRPVTDSLTVAETFGKEHRRVLQDIRELECSEEFRVHHFVHTPYTHPQNGQTYEKCLMTYDGFTFLAFGYTGTAASNFKEKYINEFNRMRDELTKLTINLPQNYKEALLALVESVEKTERLELENTELRTKVKYVDQILMSKGTMTITQIAKDYGLSGPQLNKILHEERVQYKQNKQWLLYQKYATKGYTQSSTIDITRSNGDPDVTLNTRWTQNGRLFIHELLTKRDILPNIERHHKVAQLEAIK